MGKWKGYVISKNMDYDNRNGMPVTLTITDDADNGDYVGDMVVSYRYQTDVYRAKYTVEGNINYVDYTISVIQTGLVYSDLLPKGLNWCFSSGDLNIYRSTSAKKLYIDGYVYVDCTNENVRMILIKMD